MQKDCSFWFLKNEHKIPSLNELSVCVNIKRRLSNSYWTAFTYLHPNKTRIELGLKGFGEELHIIMFGRVWTKSSVVTLDNWHSICMTWSKSMTEPKVYVNGTKVELKPQSETALHPYCCSVAAGGTLTLAVAHNFVKNKISIETGTELKGSLSLFRMWKQVRSAQEISTMACTDGDMLHWEKRIWNKAQDCTPIQDVTQKCNWPFYEVKLVLIIIREDGNKTNIYDAREVAHQWLTQALEEWPKHVYLHKVKVFPIGSTLTRSNGSAKGGTMQLFATSPGLSQFDCLAHLNVIPNADVGQIQDELTEILAKRYKIDHYEINTDANFIFIYTLDDLWPDLDTNPPLTGTETQTTTIPQLTSTATEIITPAKTIVTTPNQVAITTEVVSSSTETTKITTSTPFMETTLAGSSTTFLSSTRSLTLNTAECSSTISPEGNISESYFSVNVNVTVNGSGDPENIITTWLQETLSGKGIQVLHFKLLTSSTHAQKRSVETKSFKVDRKHSLSVTR
ncbi:adhesion G-protein coupled receptor G4-like [Carassius carassius]|uniref:adhesion G-protein coupled receptor G4-like n=1 Tax=Carassius carassius TaxID=217509 RepID=UPI0028692FEB|nr:adhesion G-protein coupled receptor G4-like [Carassius carassius]